MVRLPMLGVGAALSVILTLTARSRPAKALSTCRVNGAASPVGTSFRPEMPTLPAAKSFSKMVMRAARGDGGVVLPVRGMALLSGFSISRVTDLLPSLSISLSTAVRLIVAVVSPAGIMRVPAVLESRVKLVAAPVSDSLYWTLTGFPDAWDSWTSI